MSGKWNQDTSRGRIKSRIQEVNEITIKEYTREKSLANIQMNHAFRVHGTHLYIEILNMQDILNTTKSEGVFSHKRALRFLDLHQRAVRRVLDSEDCLLVDFHGQRLHAVVAKPYSGTDEEISEKKRVHRAVSIADLISNILEDTGDEQDQIPPAEIRVGIDTGTALAVNNGRADGREPLFLGAPANRAAKLSAGAKAGIFLTKDARRTIGLPTSMSVKECPLTDDEIETSKTKASLNTSKETILDGWRKDRDKFKLSDYEFSRHTPPLAGLDFDKLTPKNARRMELVSMFADLDGFSKFVSDRIANAEREEDIVRALHVIRGELGAVLRSDMGGKRVRFIGDCAHGLVAVGTAYQTDEEESVSEATLAAGALRSAFALCLEELDHAGIECDDLGLAIGLDLGPVSMLRLGLKGKRKRCAMGRAVFVCEEEQIRCTGKETAIGEHALEKGSLGVKKLFEEDRKTSDLDYQKAVYTLSEAGDSTAKIHQNAGASPFAIAAASEPLKAHGQSEPSWSSQASGTS